MNNIIDKLATLNLTTHIADSSRIHIIQSCLRGYAVRRYNSKPKDSMSLVLIGQIVDRYNENYSFCEGLNNLLAKKKIRNANFPSEASENIAKFAIHKYTSILGCWDTKCGDLVVLNKRVEIKGFMSNGPSSFGPCESWDLLCFVDAVSHLDKHFTVYLVSLTNTDVVWSSIKMNKTETYASQCAQKRRPRISFAEIKKQIPQHIRVIFTGYLRDL